MRVNDLSVSRHFKLREFECRCCHAVKVSPVLLARLERLRRLWKNPIILTSGYRCALRNQEAGGVSRSRHRTGCAADVRVGAAGQEEFCALALKCGFTKVIPYGERGFVHVEV